MFLGSPGSLFLGNMIRVVHFFPIPDPGSSKSQKATGSRIRKHCFKYLAINDERGVNEGRDHVQGGAVEVRVVGEVNDPADNEAHQQDAPVVDGLVGAGDELEHPAHQREPQLKGVLYDIKENYFPSLTGTVS